MKKRIMAILLVAVMLLSLSTTALAEEINSGIPTGTADTEASDCPADTHAEESLLYVSTEETVVLENGGEGDTAETEPEQETPVAEQTAGEQLAMLIAALPAPEDIDPENEEQAETVHNQIEAIYAYADENGIDVKDNEVINAVIAALSPAALLTEAETLTKAADPAVVVIADKDENNADAQGAPYATLEEALEHLQYSDIIVLQKDITVNTGLTISRDRGISLDLNGHTVTMEGDGRFIFTSYGQIKNGSTKAYPNSSKSEGKIVSGANCTGPLLVIQNASVSTWDNNGAITIEKTVGDTPTVDITDGELYLWSDQSQVINSGDNGSAVYAHGSGKSSLNGNKIINAGAGGNAVKFEGGTLNMSFAGAENSGAGGCALNVLSGEVSCYAKISNTGSNGTAIRMAGSKLTYNGESNVITSSSGPAVVLSQGEFIAKTGSITQTGKNTDAAAAIQVTGGASDTSITVEGGNIRSDGGYCIDAGQTPVSVTGGSFRAPSSGSAFKTGGTFTISDPVTERPYVSVSSGSAFELTGNAKVTVNGCSNTAFGVNEFVKGGKLSSGAAVSITGGKFPKCIAEIENYIDTATLKVSSDGTVILKAGVSSSDGNTYETLKEAVEAAGSTPVTLKVNSDMVFDQQIVIEADQNITLDLGAYALESRVSSALEREEKAIHNKGTLTILGDEGGAIRSGGNYTTLVMNEGENAHLVIGNSDGTRAPVIDATPQYATAVINRDGTVDIYGGTFDGLDGGIISYGGTTHIQGATISSLAVLSGEATVSNTVMSMAGINGGTLTLNDGVQLASVGAMGLNLEDGELLEVPTTVIINGGQYSDYVTAYGNAAVQINGGEFENFDFDLDESAEVQIFGGTFDADVSAYKVAEACYYQDGEKWIAVKTHTEVIDEAVGATCTETGLTEGKHCSVCNTTLVTQETVPATGHNYTAVVTAPTCTEKGYTTHTCFNCNDSYTDSETEATGHSLGEWEIVSAPDCTNKGIKQRVCSACDFHETEDVDIDPNAHIWEEQFTVDQLPTATADGSKSIHCKNCEVVKDSTVIPALEQQTAVPVDIPDGKTLITDTVSAEAKTALDNAANDAFKNEFSGKKIMTVEVSLMDNATWEAIHDEIVTFTIGYPAGITSENYKNYDFVVLHQKVDGTMELSNFVATADGLKITSTLSPFAIGYSERHTHSFAAEWKSDNTNHWKECVCGEKSAVAAHDFKWVTDKAATATSKGSRHKECSVCGYKTESEAVAITAGTVTTPQTGDNSNLALWFALLVVSGSTAAGIFLYSRKGRHN